MKRLPLIVIAVLLVASALVVASRPAAADQNDDRLDKLFMRLLEAPVPGEAQQIEGEIWHIWMQSDDGAINGLMRDGVRSEEHTSELQSLMRISYAVFCLKKKNRIYHTYAV